jgi:putative SOS response-associated peptidase YedK
MCGRFVSSSTPDQIAAYFSATPVSEKLLEPNYNVAPTSDIYVIVDDPTGVRQLDAYHWGLVPRWAKDPSVGNRMVNARAETLAEKSTYRSAFRQRRCIVPADGFYEWKKIPGQKNKQPVYLHRGDGEQLAFAGLWEEWHRGDQRLRSTTIITCAANELIAPIHDRMPVVLPPTAWRDWLDPAIDDTATLGQLLVPAPPALFAVHEVSTEVNSVRNKGPHLIEPAEPAAPAEPTLALGDD